MNQDQNAAPTQLAEWVAPVVTRMEAGSAEDSPRTFPDGANPS